MSESTEFRIEHDTMGEVKVPLHALYRAQTQRAVEALREAGLLPGNFYWYNNNWHYIRKWDHLKQAITLNHLHPDLQARIQQEAQKDFSASDAIMSRCISTSISLLWTDEQIHDKGTRMAEVIRKAI